MTYLTADCGATHSSWVIYSEEGNALDRGLLPGINFVEAREEGLSRFLMKISELNLPSVDYAAFSIAGTGIDVYHSLAVASIRLLRNAVPAEKGIYLFNDGEAALWNSFAGNPGVTVISGTGAIAYGKNRNGKVYRCGGWGVWAGDEGSAYWIAQEAVRAVSHHFDGRYEETALTDLVLKNFQLREVPDLIPVLHGSNISRKEIASIARLVSAAASTGDAIAENILASAGTNLAEQAHAIIRQIGYTEDLKVSCQGSVLLNDKAVYGSFLKELRNLYGSIDVITNSGRSEWGVYLLLKHSLDRGITPEIVLS